MKVTDKKYYMDDAYVRKLDLMIKRMNGVDDNVLPIDGDEGQGKTEFACGTCYYIACMTKRKYGIDNIFFELDKAMEFAGKTKAQIIHIDEGALGLLRTQWQGKLQQKFIQFVMVARKKRHFIIICIPKFHRLPQYLMEERAIGLVHIYSRRNLEKGRFCYYKKSAKDRLFQDWERKKIKNYKKYYSLHGTFVQVMNKIFTQEEVDEYEKKKDKAIMDLVQGEPDKNSQSRFVMQRNILIKMLWEQEGKPDWAKLSRKLKSLGVELGRDQCKTNVLSVGTTHDV